MEEKDYKKLYEDTVALAKDGLKDGLYLSQSAKAVTEFLFPQLKETEDEKIRRELTKFLINFNNGYYSKPSETEIDSWIKWIDKKCEQKSVECIKLDNEFENQISHLIASVLNGEHEYNKGFVKYASQSLLGFANKDQNHTDKVEPKFKAGDWIVYEDNIWKICYINLNTYYELLNLYNELSIRHIEGVDKTAHPWTIQDAKDGDVLADCFGNICIYQKPSTNTYYHTHCYGSHKYFIDGGGSHEVTGTYPATKEQRDLLFQKMEEAGYEWDSEKKELREIEKQGEQKTEIEYIYPKFRIGDVIEPIKPNGFYRPVRVLSIEKKTKSYYCESDDKKSFSSIPIRCENEYKLVEQKPAEWSEDDEFWLKEVERCVRAEYPLKDSKIIDWLKSLKERVQPQPKQEWSEEDKSMYIRTLGILGKCYMGELPTKVEEELKWFKSIEPQSHWKPSKDQMFALSMHIQENPNLESLYNDLKKL